MGKFSALVVVGLVVGSGALQAQTSAPQVPVERVAAVAGQSEQTASPPLAAAAPIAAAEPTPEISLPAPVMTLRSEPPIVAVLPAPTPELPTPAMTLGSAPPAIAAPVAAAPIVTAPAVVPPVVVPPASTMALPAIAMPQQSPAVPPVPQAETPRPAHPLAAELRQRLEARAKAARTKSDRERQAAINEFYAKRSDVPVFLNDQGAFNGRARAVLAAFAAADDYGLDARRFAAPGEPAAGAADEAKVAAELGMVEGALTYASHARGGRIDPSDLSLYLDRKPPVVPTATVLNALADAEKPDTYLQGLHPKHPQFEALRRAWLEARAGRLPSGMPETPVAPAPENATPGKTTKAKASAAPAAPPSPAAVAERLLVNMEMWRWMPEQLGNAHIFVNIPEFTFRVKQAGRVIHQERVITGKTDTQTPVFSDEMDHIVINPYWNVPDSIKVKELLPYLSRGSTAGLSKHNLKMAVANKEIDPLSVNWRSDDIRRYHVFQPPGPGNALGEVKFMFPNNHHVYMHDTPTKNLFNSTSRAFSHGCVRVRNPRKFAEVVLNLGKGWSAERTISTFNSSGPNNTVRLDQRLPVHIAYFTASVDDKGTLALKRDIYGYEKLVRMGLDGKAHLIVKTPQDLTPPRAEPVARLADTSPKATDRAWMRNAFSSDN